MSEPKRHFVFIINPSSGTDRKKPIENSISKACKKARVSHEIRRTLYAGHAKELARVAAAANAYAVVAIGGDGSINEVANGIIGTSTKLGIIPKGSGNGLASSLGIPFDTDEAINKVLAGSSILIDVAYANNKMFLSNAGIGFDAEVSKAFAKSKKRGFLGYTSIFFNKLWRYKQPVYKLQCNGELIETRAFIINVANGKYMGYNIQIASDANPMDGLLDVAVIKPFPKLYAAILFFKAWNGKLIKSKTVMHLRSEAITVKQSSMKYFQVDGDAHRCNGKVEIGIKKLALEVIA